MAREFLTYFTFDNNKCFCEVENIADNRTNSLTSYLAVKNVENSTIPMAYFYGEGLRITNIRNKSKNNILGEFLGIKKNDLYGYKSFFEKYGFLFNLKNNSYNRLSIEDIDNIKDSLMAFVLLLKNQFNIPEDKSKINVKELLDSSLYLIFRKKIEIKIDEEFIFKLDESVLKNIIESTPYHQEDKSNIRYKKIKGQIIEYFYITDSLADNGVNEIAIENFSNFMHQDNPQWFISLCRVYKNKNQILHDGRYNTIIDFLFNFVIKYSMFLPSDINLNGTFENDIYELLSSDEKMVKALVKVSKILLEDEFENNLSDVTPTFNVDDMMPDWKLPSLYTALYFSLFYLNNKDAGLRKCGNENCNQFFQVSKSNSKKKYCSIECCNAVGQRNYQKRQRQKKK